MITLELISSVINIEICGLGNRARAVCKRFRIHPAETSKHSDICDFLKVSDIGIALYSMEI